MRDKHLPLDMRIWNVVREVTTLSKTISAMRQRNQDDVPAKVLTFQDAAARMVVDMMPFFSERQRTFIQCVGSAGASPVTPPVERTAVPPPPAGA